MRRTLGNGNRSSGSAFQQAELTASGGARGDNFGYSVAVSGSTAVVGAYGRKSFTGAAYVFVRSGSIWSEQAELTASDRASGDEFGASVAISGSTAVIGAPDKKSGTGAVYVFVRSGSSWSEQRKLTASNAAAGNFFGISVAVSGSSAVVGAYGRKSNRGAAYVFVRAGSSWEQQAELTPRDGAAGDFFGDSVAISGSSATVGAPGASSYTGATYVFARSGGSWSQQGKLSASDGVKGDDFGDSVAISRSTVVVGAGGKKADTGAAYVFAHSGTAWSQKAELSASDGASGDRFGSSVALSGPTVLVGAYGRNSFTGAAYVFAHSGSSWQQESELSASDGAAGDELGYSVAIDGSTAVIGAFATNPAGAAYAFLLPTQQAKLTASDGTMDDFFGTSVAISGSSAVVGAPSKNSATGAAYVFVHSDGSWHQQAKLTAYHGSSDDAFGFAVAISGSTAVIGAFGRNSAAGAAYVFVRSGTTWHQQAELTVPDGASGDVLGSSVAISGSTAVIGAPGKVIGEANPGAAYVFVRSGSTWSQQTELTASDGAGGDNFGSSVAISGSTAVVGAPHKNSFAGAAYVFVASGSSWSQQAELTASDAAPSDYFGASVAISGSTAIIGAPANEPPEEGPGAAYVFVGSGSSWSQQAELTASNAAPGDAFGESVAISGSTVVIGAPVNNSHTGAAYVFVGSGSSWSQQAELTASNAAANDEFAWSVAVSGSTAVMGARGKNSSTGAAYAFGNL